MRRPDPPHCPLPAADDPTRSEGAARAADAVGARGAGAGRALLGPLPVVHLELHTGDPDGAGGFYADVCGWRPRAVDTSAGPYTSLELGGRLGGGVVGSRVRRPIWVPYVEVTDVVAATDGARAAGATVLLEPREGPTGWRSVVASAAGGEIAFWQPKPLPTRGPDADPGADGVPRSFV